MKIYFVRHGESKLGESRHQLPETPLSELGRKQAKALAQRFASIPAELLVSSTYIRSLETVSEISRIKPVPIMESDLFVERKMPNLFLGKLVKDPEVYPILEEIRKHFYEPSWHYAEEENFADLTNRSQEAFLFLQTLKEKNVVVVTHGYFLSVLIFNLIFQKNIDPRQFKLFFQRTVFSNTGITLCEFENSKWKLITLNDSLHIK